jgi:Ca-activated chloride channel family protein
MAMSSLLSWAAQPRWKPLFFGLLGLAGGLLAALLVGEPLWLRLRPPPALPPGSGLHLTASPEVVLNQGGKNRFGVRIVRERFARPVQVTCEGLPEGVRAGQVVLPADQTTAELELEADAQAAVCIQPLRVVAQAEGVARAEADVSLQVVPSPRPLVDLLFVLDITGSMQPLIDGVKQSIQDFARELQTGNLDARVGLVAFRDRLVKPPQEAEVLQFGDGPFTKDTVRFQQEVGRLVANGGGGTPEESALDGMALAARQPFRPSATKVLLLITDQPPNVPDKEIRSVSELGDVLRENSINQLHLIVPPHARSAYQPLQTVSPGGYFDLAAASKSKDSFARFLPTVGRAVARQAVASQPPRQVAAAAPPPPPARGIQSTQEFAAESGHRLLVAASVWTAVLAAGICLALTAGQWYYVRRAWPRLGELVTGGVGGLLAGLLAGGAGQMLFRLLPSHPQAEPLLHAGSWAMLGALVGLGMALLMPNLSLPKGLLSGALGGLLASLSWRALTAALPGGAVDLAGRLLSAAILGLCLGLVVVVVEILSRRFWLEIADGRGPVLRVNLGSQPVFIGGDPHRCTVAVPQAPPRALRFLVRDGQVECLDVLKEQAFFVSPGYRRQLASSTVVVCGQGVAAPPAAPAGQRAAAPPVAARWWLRLESGRALPLGLGTRLTAADLPGLDPLAGSDTAEVVAHPARPGELGLTNRSRQVWSVSLSGAEHRVEPGRTIQLLAGTHLRLGLLRGELRAGPPDREAAQT